MGMLSQPPVIGTMATRHFTLLCTIVCTKHTTRERRLILVIVCIVGNSYFCRDSFYWRMNSNRQVDRVGYVKYDLLNCSGS